MAYIEDFKKAISSDIDFKLTILGRNSLILEGYKSILYYSKNEIHIKVHKAILKLKGSEFYIKEIMPDTLILVGILQNYEVEYL